MKVESGFELLSDLISCVILLHNKCRRLGDLNSRMLFFSVLEAKSSNITVQANLVPFKGSFFALW